MKMSKQVALGLWLPLLTVTGWEVCSGFGILDPLFFPAPSRLAASAWRLTGTGELGRQAGATVTRMGIGFFCGAVAGLLLGALMGASRRVGRSLEPSLSALYSAPKLSLLPMVMLLAGVGESSRLLLVAAAAFVLVAFHALDGIRGVDRSWVELASHHGAGRWMILRKVFLPACMPQLFTGLRLAAGRALVVTISIELINAPDGLGSMILMSWQTFATEKLYIGVILTAALGAILHAVMRRIELKLVPWRN
ncbi:MAG: ABC transporter permease [Acidimicrobiia bacterium]|nr:ABC transporter permease [Acidimicrobiia bacterium]